jgi:hypothetical protein
MHISLRPHINFSRGRNKLNLLLFEEDWQSAIAEIECHPHETKIWSARPGFFDGDHESNVLPIHVACSVHAPIEVIKAIVEAHPEGVQAIESAFKRLPIHVACQFAARADVVDCGWDTGGGIAVTASGPPPFRVPRSTGCRLAYTNHLPWLDGRQRREALRKQRN